MAYIEEKRTLKIQNFTSSALQYVLMTNFYGVMTCEYHKNINLSIGYVLILPLNVSIVKNESYHMYIVRLFKHKILLEIRVDFTSKCI